MTNDELMAVFAGAFTEAHARVTELPNGPDKTQAQRLLAMFHHAGNVFAEHASNMGAIQPFDGTSKPPPGP